VSCPFGVVDLIAKASEPHYAHYNDATLNQERKLTSATALQATGGVSAKCTLCYDRQKIGMVPACAKACPTESIQFGEIEELKERARKRVGTLQARGTDAYLYGVDSESSVGDLNAFFLLVDKPEAYNLPEKPVLPSTRQRAGYTSAAVAASALVLLGFAIFRSAK
ncbi:MAG: 4Fe-4S dicluster domain-containing protein, partial [Vulcanimicrobiaceae bacterium]